ncbi:MAG: histone deacetylase [bacterium]|nr:histone deacetylase [bacterium]
MHARSRKVHYIHYGETRIDIGPHVFPIEKYAILARWLTEELGVDRDRMHDAEAIDADDLARVHAADYVDDLMHARTSWRTARSELPVDAQVIGGFLAMVGGGVTATRLALDHGIGFHVGGGFHHAFADHAEGFCYVNDVAVGIERMRHERGLGTVLIVDVDVHQGNGTAAIYRDDPATFTYSIHQEHNYPIKEKSDLDRGLMDGVNDADYLALLRADLETIDARCEPELVCYLAGVDPYQHDQLGGLGLTAPGLVARDRLVLDRYATRGIPIAVSLAGGYARSPEETARLHLGTMRVAEEV